jgi:uncharacterized delta-60 repeat protein
MRTSGRNRWAALATLAMLAPHAAIGADGDLDVTFGDGGIAFTGIVDGGGAVSACGPVVQTDGKILLCSTREDNGSSGSDMFVARFTAEGELDPTFSFDGKVTIDFDGGSGGDAAKGLALQADGRIVVVGSTSPDIAADHTDFAIARLTATGDLDPAFGGGSGKRTVAFDLDAGEGDDSATDVVIQADGKILVAGTADQATGSDFALVRLLQDGTTDAAFNLTGKVTVVFDLAASTTDVDMLARVKLDDDGRILLGGSADNGPGGFDFALARLLPNGQLDNNFDADGRTTLAFDLGGTNVDQLIGMTVQRDGRIVAIGAAVLPGGSNNNDFAVVRWLPDGTPDPGFGIGGKTIVPFDLAADGADLGLAVVEEANGRLLLAGGATWNLPNNSLAAALARLRPDGTLDLSFGVSGKRSFQLGLAPVDSQAFMNFAWQGSSIVIGGIAIVDDPAPNPVDNFLVRLENDLLFADGFE